MAYARMRRTGRFRKRKYNPGFKSGYPSKRRKFGRKRPRTYTLTGDSGKVVGSQFRGRKIGPARWRNKIWNDTLAKSHYRSLGQLAQNATAYLSSGFGKGNVKMIPMITVDDNYYHSNPFWISNGGARILDRDSSVPTFEGDLVIRGGLCRYTVTNPDGGVPVLMRVYGVWANKNPNYDVYTGMESELHDLEWDPSINADFSSFGKIMFKKETLLLPGARPFSVVYRLRPQKIENQVFRGTSGVLLTSVPAGAQPWWVYQMVPLINNASADDVISIISFNLSFSGDTDRLI